MSTLHPLTYLTVSNNLDILTEVGENQKIYSDSSHKLILNPWIPSLYHPISYDDLEWTLKTIKQIKDLQVDSKDRKQKDLLKLISNINTLQDLLFIGVQNVIQTMTSKLGCDGARLNTLFEECIGVVDQNKIMELRASLIIQKQLDTESDQTPPPPPLPPPLPPDGPYMYEKLVWEKGKLVRKFVSLNEMEDLNSEMNTKVKEVETKIGNTEILTSVSSQKTVRSISSLERKAMQIREQVETSSDSEEEEWDPNASYLTATGGGAFLLKPVGLLDKLG